MKKSKFTVGSMFAGIGGICTAFKSAGFEIIWANEIDKYACMTYKLNFNSDYMNMGDIRNVDANVIPNFDILTSGFPCQAFSTAGLLKGFKDPRGNLFFETARIIDEKKPRAIFLENVANLVKHDNGRTISIIIQTLNKIGYNIKYKVMNAKEYGNIPQQRNRIYIVGFLSRKDYDNFNFPNMIPLTRTAFDLLDGDKKEEKYYLNDHAQWNNITKYTSDKNKIYRFTDWGISSSIKGVCPTLLAAMGSKYERIPFFHDKYSIRLLTPRECLRLQGFSNKFIIPDIDEKEIYKQIGNSVCVPVVNRIAKNILETFEKGEK